MEKWKKGEKGTNIKKPKWERIFSFFSSDIKQEIHFKHINKN